MNILHYLFFLFWRLQEHSTSPSIAEEFKQTKKKRFKNDTITYFKIGLLAKRHTEYSAPSVRNGELWILALCLYTKYEYVTAIKKIHKMKIFPYGIPTTAHCTSPAWVWLWKICRFIMDYLNGHSNFEQKLQEHSILYHTKIYFEPNLPLITLYCCSAKLKAEERKKNKKNWPKCVRVFFWLDTCFSLELYHFDCIHKWMSKWWKELKFAKVIGCQGDSYSAFKLDCVGLGLRVWFTAQDHSPSSSSFLFFSFVPFFMCPKIFLARKGVCWFE